MLHVALNEIVSADETFGNIAHEKVSDLNLTHEQKRPHHEKVQTIHHWWSALLRLRPDGGLRIIRTC